MKIQDIGEIIEEFRNKIQEKINKNNIPGLAIAVLNKNENLWLEGFGYTDRTKKQVVNEDTLFGLQSTTKTYTAIAFLIAIQKGLVKLDDPIIKYYPEFYVKSRYDQEEYKKITFRHLLNHTSGLVREATIGGCFSRKLGTWEEHIKSLNETWLSFPVGTKFSYSNIGMDLITFILEKIVGKPYHIFIQEVLGNPLGITIHWFLDDIYGQPNAVIGHLGEDIAHKLDEMAFGCGGIFISIKDQATFVRFLLNRGKIDGKVILREDIFELLYDIKGETGYGLGTEISNKYGIKFYSHAGGGFGLASEMYWLPKQNLGIALLHNEEYNFDQIREFFWEIMNKLLEAKGIATQLEKFPYTDEPVISLKEEKLKRLEGTYQNIEAIYKIKIIDGKLNMIIGRENSELTPHSEIAFSIKPKTGIIFHLNKQGEPIGNTQYHSKFGILTDKYLGKLITELPKVNEEWKKFVGLYFLKFYYTEYNFVAITIDKEGFLHYENNILYPHNESPNVFFTEFGTAVVFEEEAFRTNNILHTRVNNPVEFCEKLLESEPNHKALFNWGIETAINLLKKLNKKSEAAKINELLQFKKKQKK